MPACLLRVYACSYPTELCARGARTMRPHRAYSDLGLCEIIICSGAPEAEEPLLPAVWSRRRLRLCASHSLVPPSQASRVSGSGTPLLHCVFVGE